MRDSGLFTLLADRRGGALIEFALVLPILLIVAMPITDYFLFSLQKQKTNRAAMTYADMVSLSLPVTNNVADDDLLGNASYLTLPRLRAMTDIYNAMMQPFVRNASTDVGSTDHIIISSIYQPVATGPNPNPQPVVMWQFWVSRDGDREVFGSVAPQVDAEAQDESEASTFGAVGADAVVPAGFDGNMYPGENFIAVEVRTYYRPVLPGFSPFLGGSMIQSTKIFPARYGALCRLAKNGDGAEPRGCP